MSKENKSSDIKAAVTKKFGVLRKVIIAGLFMVALMGILWPIALVYNNVSISSNMSFTKSVDTGIRKAENWVKEHKSKMLEYRNVAMLAMLKRCNVLKSNAVFEDIIASSMDVPAGTQGLCWFLQLDPNRPVSKFELNQAIQKENIDYKWMLYALAPDKASITPEQMQLFDKQRWQRRKLTHQLYALILLRETKGPDKKVDELIEHLCNRLSGELIFDLALVDIYIQKVTFVLIAGFPEKIRSRWVERIIANQLPDGGWNDRWFCFASRRKPIFNFAVPPGNQHATVQALTALYMVRYLYPEHFGLK